MQLLLGYIFSPIYYLAFGLTLAVFQPIQMISRKLGGYKAHTRSVKILNHFLINIMYIMGVRMLFEGREFLPKDRPIIVVANHQSLFDIQAYGHIFRKYDPKFVAKIELSKGIPSISYNLRHGGSALIDRANGGQSIREIIRLGRFIEENNYAACIYAEGTRNPSGIVQKFQSAGVKSMLKVAPSAVVVPFVIKGHSDMLKKGNFPLLFGVKLTYKALPPIEPNDRSAASIVEECEMLIKKELGQA